uniref:Rho guanine nucleotide exchange factor 5 n=1 Tax=Salvator merianae TaxID=96440 RepID=A0A8D0KPD6_SALMN
MSNVPEEEVAVAKKEDVCFSQDIALLFAMEEQLWGRLSNSVEGETSVELENDQRDPEKWGGFSEGESDPKVQEAFVKDSRVPPLNCHQGHLIANDALSSYQSSLDSETPLTQIPSPFSGVSRGERGAPGPTICCQDLNPCNSSSEIQTKEDLISDTSSPQKESGNENFPMSHNSSLCYQNAVSFQASSDEHYSREKIWRRDEMPSKTEEVDKIQPTSSTKDAEVKERELKNAESPIYQLSCEISEGRRIYLNVLHSDPNKFVSLPVSNKMDTSSDTKDQVEDLVQKMLICGIPHLQEKEKNTGCEIQSLEETVGTKHADNHTDYCGKSESAHKNGSKNLESELAMIEQGRQLRDTELNDQRDLAWKAVENETRTEQEKLELRFSDQEEQNWYLQVTETSGKGVMDETATSSTAVDINSLCNLENNSGFSDSVKSTSLIKAKEFAFSFKEPSLPGFSSESIWTKASGSGAANSKVTSVVGILPEGDSQRVDPLIYHDFGQLEYSGTCAKEVSVCPKGKDSKELTEEDNSVENRCSENAGDEGSAWKADDEVMASSCRNDITILDPCKHLQYSQTLDHPIDTEISATASSLWTKTARSFSEENAGKGASNDSRSCAGLCKESDSIQKPPKQNLCMSCPLGLVALEEVSELESNVDIQVPSRNDTSLPKDAQGLGSKSLQDLTSTSKQSTELSHDLSLTTLDLVSFQAQDPTINYIEQHLQYLNTSARNSVYLGKEEESDALCIAQQSSLDESPCVLVLEKDRTECDCNPKSLASHSNCSDVVQSVKPLSPVPVSNETLVPEDSYNLFSQYSAMSDCRQPVQFLTYSSDAEAQSQPSPAPLGLPYPSQSLQQLFSPIQTSHFLPKDPQSSAVASDTESFGQPPSSEYNTHQPTPQSSSSDHHMSLGYDANQSPPVPIIFKNPKNSIFPAFHANQIRDSTVPELDCSLSGFVINSSILNPFPASLANNKPSSTENNQFAQHPVETHESNLFNDHIGDDDDDNNNMHTDVHICQTTPNTYETEDPAPITSLEGTLEDLSVVELAKSDSIPSLKGEKDWNTHKASGDSGVSLLDTHSDLVHLGNDTSRSKIDRNTDNETSSSEATETRCTVQHPPFLAFTNPMHFFQLGPPLPSTMKHPCKQQYFSQEPLWQQQQKQNATMDAEVMRSSTITCQEAKGPERFRDGFEKPGLESMPSVLHSNEDVAKHPPLEKSSSCPSKNVIGLDSKLAFSSKKQEVLIKQRAKSKDWHRQGVRKASVPTDNVSLIASLAPLQVEASAYKKRSEYIDQLKYGEKKPPETVENFKRRHSKLINSSRLLYQEYSDVALNKAIQSQKRADSLSEDLELESSISQRLQKKVLSPQDSYLLSVSSGSSLWQDIPMVRGSTVLLSMTREEQKLQESKFELIASEASYLRSLNVAVDHFQHSPELQALLTNQDKQWLFSRLQDVRDVSANFLFDLEEKLEENMFTFNVCDVALKHAPEFRRVYLPYVTNQTYQEKTFQRLLNGVPAFQQVLERLESDPVCQRLSLKSFLILPFQRITRLKLLLQNILKKIQPGADEEVQATQAYDALEKLIKDCNENIQRMKNTEELIYLSQNMEFECKIFPLISQSRRLVKRGELTALEYNLSVKWKITTRPIYLHLFNDYLLLSRPKENGRFIVFDYAASSDVRGEKCEVKLHGANKNVFRLFLLRNHQRKKVEFLFRTETQSEKLKWISALRPQQAEPDLLNDSDTPQVQCVKPYKARENDELALEKADIVMVLQQSTDGWIEGVKLSDGERGWFPLDQVEFISCRHARQMNLEEEQRVKNAKQQIFHKK